MDINGMDRRKLYAQLYGKPNFILIHTDQQRADCVNVYGRRGGLYTPHQDSIANQGARFDASYSACPVCIPQRLSLLTGQSPQRHGVYDNVGIPDLELDTTLAHEMNRMGYRTGMVGRTMHTYPFSNPYGFTDYLPGDPTNNERDKDGFAQFYAQNAPVDCGGYNGNGTCGNYHFAAPFHLENRFHQTMWATNRAIDYIHDRQKDRTPFLLCVGYFAPHSPHNPPKEWMDYYLSLDLKDDPSFADYDIEPETNGNPFSPYVKLEGEELRRVRAAYYGNISFIDAQIGRILNEIITLPNTYVIFVSDHGEMLGDHYHVHKSMPYQGAVHTPFMIYGPGIASNQVIDTPIGWQDIMPTILELADAPIPESVDGISFAGTLLGKATEKEREYIHGECPIATVRFGGYEHQNRENNIAYENGFHYLTDGKMKYIWFNASGREQLFNLTEDYGEKNNLAHDPAYQSELEKWRNRLVRELAGRPEGFSDGKQLICAPERQLSPKMQELCDRRIAEGKRVAYYIPRNFKEIKSTTI